VTPKVQGRDPIIFEAEYLVNRARQMDGDHWPPIKNRTLGVEWSRDRRRHVTPKGQGRDPIIFEAVYLINGAR